MAGTNIDSELLVGLEELRVDIFLEMADGNREGETLSVKFFLDALKLGESVDITILEDGRSMRTAEKSAEAALGRGLIEIRDGTLHGLKEGADRVEIALSQNQVAFGKVGDFLLKIGTVANDGSIAAKIDLGGDLSHLLVVFGGENLGLLKILGGLGEDGGWVDFAGGRVGSEGECGRGIVP